MGNDGKRDKDDAPSATGVAAGLLGDAVKKVFNQDLKLPKEALNVLLQTAGKGKDEITNRVSNEIIKIVSKIDWVKEFARFAETHKFKVSAEIEILKKKDED